MKKPIVLVIAVICFITGCFAGCTRIADGGDVFSSNTNTESSIQGSRVDDEDKPWYQKVDILNNLPDQWTTLAVETDDFVYYISKAGINKFTKTDNTDEQLVLDETIEGLSKYGERIFYHNLDEIKCIDITNDKINDIWDWSKVPEDVRKEYTPEICGFWFYQDDLYVMDSYTSAVRVDLKTGKVDDFLRDFSSVAFIGNNCYYTEHAGRTFSVYEMGINTKEVKLLLGDGRYDPSSDSNKCFYDGIRTAGDKLYYTMRHNDEGIYLYNPEGEDTFLIPTDYVSLAPYYTSDYFYYYVNTDSQYELYEYSLKEKTKRLIATNKEYFRSLLLTDSHILFRPYENAELICLEY